MKQRYEHQSFRRHLGILRPPGLEAKLRDEMHKQIKTLEQDGWELVQIINSEDDITMWVKRPVETKEIT